MAENSFMKIHYQKIEKRKPVIRDNWQTLGVETLSVGVDLDDVGMILWDPLLPVVEPDSEEVDEANVK